jgi:hypothetical protein
MVIEGASRYVLSLREVALTVILPGSIELAWAELAQNRASGDIKGNDHHACSHIVTP